MFDQQPGNEDLIGTWVHADGMKQCNDYMSDLASVSSASSCASSNASSTAGNRAFEAEMKMIRRLSSQRVQAIGAKKVGRTPKSVSVMSGSSDSTGAAVVGHVGVVIDEQLTPRVKKMQRRMSFVRQRFGCEMGTHAPTMVAPTPTTDNDAGTQTSRPSTPTTIQKGGRMVLPQRGRSVLLPLMLIGWMAMGSALTVAILAARPAHSPMASSMANGLLAGTPPSLQQPNAEKGKAQLPVSSVAKVVGPLVVNVLAVKFMHHAAVQANAQAAVAVTASPAAQRFGRKLIAAVVTSSVGMAARGAGASARASLSKVTAPVVAPALTRAAAPVVAPALTRALVLPKAVLQAAPVGLKSPSAASATRSTIGAAVGAAATVLL